MFIRNEWYTAGWSQDLPRGESKILARTICNERIVLFRDPQGKVAALEDRCPHRGAPLRVGELVPEGIQCGYHGLVFDGRGQCVHIPGQTNIPKSAHIRRYHVVEQDEFLWVWIGDDEKVDTTKILRYPFNNDYAKWPHRNDMLHVKCNFMLLIDNLMDLTHLGFVHKTTIGGNAKVHVEAKMTTEHTDRGVKYTRWMLDCMPPPTYSKAVPFKGRVDRWQEFELVAPSLIVQWSGATDANTGAYEGQREGGFSLRLIHAITPETDSTCFYFFSAANGYRQDDPAATDQLHREIVAAFNEDLSIVAAQQDTLDHFKGRPLLDIRADGVRVQGRRLLERMLRESNGEATAEIVGR